MQIPQSLVQYVQECQFPPCVWKFKKNGVGILESCYDILEPELTVHFDTTLWVERHRRSLAIGKRPHRLGNQWRASLVQEASRMNVRQAG